MEKMKPRIRSLNDLFADDEVQQYSNEVSAPAVQTADGILIPTVVRKNEKDENRSEYEMLAGHNQQNAVNGITGLLAKEKKDLENAERQLQTAKSQFGQPFIYEAELAEKSTKLTEIDTELELGKGDDTVLDETENEDDESSEFEPVAVSVGEEV